MEQKPKHSRTWLQRAAYNLSRVAVRSIGWLLFRLTFRGNENFPTKGPALVCSNHQSYLDPILAGAMCNRRLNYLARDNLFHSKLFGGLIRFYDAIPVKRDGMSLAGLKETLRRLKRQEMVLIFPEGTRTPDGEIQALKPGFCVLARKSKVPIVPLAISGAFNVWPKGAKLPRPARVCLTAGPSISVDEIAAMSDDELIGLINQRIHECFRIGNEQNGNKALANTEVTS